MSEKLNAVDAALLETIADMPGGEAKGAVNIRKDSGCASRVTTENIDIKTKEDKPGIDIIIKPGTKKETCHIPVIITKSGLTETVYNDFFIGEDAEVTIIAGCGIHNCGEGESRHDGVHTFHIGKNARVTYVEKHYGEGDGNGARILNPVTEIYQDENSYCELESVQIRGVDSTLRTTVAHLKAGAKMQVLERLMTHGSQRAQSDMRVELDGSGSSVQIISRSVAKDKSEQQFHPIAVGNAACHAHVQCDSIIMDDAHISSIPEIAANHTEAEIIHEAAIGRINNDQLLKLQTLGMTAEEAESIIIECFLN